jgi:hypothetical protein
VPPLQTADNSGNLSEWLKRGCQRVSETELATLGPSSGACRPRQPTQLATWFAEHTRNPFTLEAVTEYNVRTWLPSSTANSRPNEDDLAKAAERLEE